MKVTGLPRWKLAHAVDPKTQNTPEMTRYFEWIQRQLGAKNGTENLCTEHPQKSYAAAVLPDFWLGPFFTAFRFIYPFLGNFTWVQKALLCEWKMFCPNPSDIIQATLNGGVWAECLDFSSNTNCVGFLVRDFSWRQTKRIPEMNEFSTVLPIDLIFMSLFYFFYLLKICP